MKKLLILLLPFFLISCAQPKQPESFRKSYQDQLFEGEHKLRRLANFTGQESKFSGGFFLFMGGVDGESKQLCQVKFAWELPNGSYAISSLPLDKIRVRLIRTIKAPTIKFKWKDYGYSDYYPLQHIIDQTIIYAEISVQERNWESEYQYPLDKEKSN